MAGQWVDLSQHIPKNGKFTHELITKGLNGVIVYFADSYCSWQKGLIEYTTIFRRLNLYLDSSPTFFTELKKSIIESFY